MAGLCARPRGRPRRHRPPQPPPPRGGPGRDRGAARASCARSRSAGTPRRPPRCSASSSDAGVFHGYIENEVFSPEVIKVAEMVASGALGRVLTMRAREGHSGPHAAHFWDAETAGGGAFLDMGCHCIEAARYIIGKDVRIARGLRLGRDARPRRQDDRRGQRHRDPPLRGRPDGHDRGVVDGQGRHRGPQRGLLRARADRPRPRLDADPGVPPGAGRLPRPRRPTPTPAGSTRSPTSRAWRATTSRCATSSRRTAPASSRARRSRTGSSSTRIIDAAYRSMRSGRWEPVEVPTLSGAAAR